MTKHTSFLTAVILAAGALAGTLSGCEIITNVDRSKIPGTGGGTTSSTTSMGTGGTGGITSSTTSSSTTSTTSTTSIGTGGTGGMGTGGTGTGGTNACSGGAKTCSTVADCPTSTTACVTAACTAGCCTTTDATQGTTCTDSSGTKCDGQGKCVACLAPTDCPTQATACVTNTCDASHACGTANAAIDTTCTDNGGAKCDGNGTCVQCLKTADCPAPTTACQIVACDTSAHTCGTTNADKGTACTDNGGVVCDGNGTCVAQHCMDNVQDSDETDVDCGGSCGATCKDTSPQQKCTGPGDCVSGVCAVNSGGSQLFCQPPTCTDGVQNGNETGKDCGGTDCDGQSKLCAVGTACGSNADCQGGHCINKVCVACVQASDCPAAPNECSTATCDSNVCGKQNKPTMYVLTTGQTAHDCTLLECDGSGNIVGVADPTDPPVSPTVCKTGSCNGTTATYTNANARTDCTADGKSPAHLCGSGFTAGTCVQCLADGDCTSACSGGMLQAAACDSSNTGTCSLGAASACPGGVKCADATSCLPSCNSDSDCQSASDYCNSGSCVPKGGAGAGCGSNGQCSSGHCGPTGAGSHCCAASTCPAAVAACGATDCDDMGLCVYPGNTVAPASLQTPGDCQKIVCNGSGGATTADDSFDPPVPSDSACQINPSCCGPSPLHICYDNAAAGTPCSSANDSSASVCGDPNNSDIAGKCVQCNIDADCLAVDDGGIFVCDTSTGHCTSG